MAAQTEKIPCSKKRKRTYNVRLLKATWPYTVREIAALFGIHRNVVREWIKQGLSADKISGEYLIRGEVVAAFLSERQQKKQCKCVINEFFCFKCRAPRRAYLGIVDIMFISPTRFRMHGLCETCNTRVNKAQAIGKLQKIGECFHVQKIEGLRIIERSDCSVNSNMEAQT